MHWRACRAVVACCMAHVTDLACAACAAGVVLCTSHEPHGRLSPFLHTPHGCAHAAGGQHKRGLIACTDGSALDIVTIESKFVSESKVPNLRVLTSL